MMTFDLVPNNIRTPGVYAEIDNSKALRGLPVYNNRILIIGQRLSSGTVTAAQGVKQVFSVEQAKSFFGKGSMLANIFKTLKANNVWIETHAIALDDHASGVAASGTIVVSGAPTENGVISLYVAGVLLPIPVITTHTVNDIAANIAAAINADVDLPVTAAVNTATVTITARNKGTVGNSLDIQTNFLGAPGGEKNVAGVTLTITAMASGATDPLLSGALALLPDEIYDYILVPYTDTSNLQAIEDELTRRWGPLVQLEGHAFTCKKDTVANLSTFGNGRNSPHVSCLGIYNTPTPVYEWLAAWVAQVGYAAMLDPARPFQTLPLKGVLAPPSASRFDQAERNTLLYDGISTFVVERGGQAQVERVITMYQTNPLGAPDPSYLDYNTLATLSYLRQSLRDTMRTKFPRYKLANDGTRFDPGNFTVTPMILRLEVLVLYRLWEKAGLVENFDEFADRLLVMRNENDQNRVDMLIPPDLVNGLLILAAKFQYLL